jgi:hypothetical protein
VRDAEKDLLEKKKKCDNCQNPGNGNQLIRQFDSGQN